MKQPEQLRRKNKSEHRKTYFQQNKCDIWSKDHTLCFLKEWHFLDTPHSACKNKLLEATAEKQVFALCICPGQYYKYFVTALSN